MVVTPNWMELPLAHSSLDYSCRVLLGLAVFQDLRRMEYIRSIHVNSEGGAAFTVQQEFLLKPGAYSQISQPIQLACFSSLSSTDLKQFMAMMRKMYERERWQCVLEFRSDSPYDTAIVPLLSAYRNPDLQSIPSLAADLFLVETGVSHRRTLSSFSAIAEAKDIWQDSYLNVRDWQLPKRRLPSLLFGCLPEEQGLTEHDDHGRGTESFGMIRSLQLDVWQKWGSDLELAGPRTSESFDLETPRGSISDVNMSVHSASMNSSSPTSSSSSSQHASMNISSLTSSSSSSQHGDSASWRPSALVESSPAMLDLPIETPTSGIDFFPGEAEILPATRSISAMTQEVHIDRPPFEDPNRCTMTTEIQRKYIAPETFKPNLMPGAKRTTSTCSDTRSGFAEEADDRYRQPEDSRGWVGLAESAERALLFDASNPGRGNAHVEERRGREVLRVETKETNFERWCYTRGSTDRLTELSMTELSQYFHMPICDASKELRVGLTVLKRRCREFGIPRWPHRKMRSLDSLIQNIQDLAKDDGANQTDRVLNTVKELEKQKKAMEEKPETELPERTKRLRQACFKASYKKRRKLQPTQPDEAADQ